MCERVESPVDECPGAIIPSPVFTWLLKAHQRSSTIIHLEESARRQGWRLSGIENKFI